MIVTRTEAVTKTKYKVYLDGQFAFVLYRGELSRYHVEEGKELTDEAYGRIRAEVLLRRAKLRALHLLNDMGRTEAQLREKLMRDGYPEDITDAAVEYVKSFGYVDDLAYAQSFIEGRKGKKSRREIRMLLNSKGLREEDIERAFEECYGQDDAEEAIRRIMEKRHYDAENADYEERQKLMAYLMRKGFSYDDVRRAVSEI